MSYKAYFVTAIIAAVTGIGVAASPQAHAAPALTMSIAAAQAPPAPPAVISPAQRAADASAAAPAGTAQAPLYRNPLRAVRRLTPERIDMGVDYGGTGPLYALGAGRILMVYQCGWPDCVYIAERLSQGRLRGRIAYYAESIRPYVRVGQRVGTGTRIGWMWGGIEVGWGSSLLSVTEAAAHGEFWGYNSTRYGCQFSWLLHHLGAPAGIRQNYPCTG